MSAFYPSKLYLKKQIHSLFLFFKVRQSFLLAMTVLVVVLTAVLYETQPYSIDDWPESYKILKLAGYGGILFLTATFLSIPFPTGLFFPPLLKKASLKKTILCYFILVFSTAIFFCLYTSLIYDPYRLQFNSIVRMVLHNFSISVFPFLFYLKLMHLNGHFMSLLKKGVVSFNNTSFVVETIVYIHVIQNYIDVFCWEDDMLKKTNILCTLKSAQETLKHYKRFLRVNNSYIANLSYSQNIKVVSNTMKLYLNHVNEGIIVSRRRKRKLIIN